MNCLSVFGHLVGLALKGLTTQHMVLFQSSFVILCTTHGSLKKISYNWTSMGKETNSSLDTVTEQTIFDFLRLSYQFLAFKGLYI